MAFPVGRPVINVVPEEEHRNVAKAYMNGWSIRKLADHYDVSTYEIRQVLLSQNVKFRNKGRQPDSVLEKYYRYPFGGK